MNPFEQEIRETRAWMEDPRFQGITRLHSARQVVEQRGTIRTDYPIARAAADAFYARLRELFDQKRAITTFGPYSSGQAVTMKRMGLEGIYLGGWATSAKGSVTEDPGPDLASYPLSQVPDEAAALVRALLAADRNQHYLRSRLTDDQRAASTPVDYRPFIIADADTGHGGDPHVRNLIRRFVEAGVPGYHIEDQRPGTKKCGHQGGKVLVASDEQIKRLNAARFQLDVMGVAGIVVARTDAEAANLIDGRGDERDHPFLLGATKVGVPSYKACTLAVLKRFHDAGAKEVNGFLLYALPEAEMRAASAWLERTGIARLVRDAVLNDEIAVDAAMDKGLSRLAETWEMESGLKTFGEAVAAELQLLADDGQEPPISVEAWREFAAGAALSAARDKARRHGIAVHWDCEQAATPEGYYQVRGGIEYAVAKSLAAAPFADLVWMETKTADLKDARHFAEAIHVRFPDKMLAYNLSPSFNWDTTGMTEEEMRRFPEELGKLGYVFNFITYGGHQIDGLAAEEFAASLRQDGMLSLARLQRRLRLLESPYRIPQTLVGGPRADAALASTSGRTATTKAMGKGSTQVQHLVQTEVPSKLLEEWLVLWCEQNRIPGRLRVRLRPHRPGAELLELSLWNRSDAKVANVIFAPIQDRRGRWILSVRDQNTFDEGMWKKRLMTLVHLFLVHRYQAESVHFVSPTEDNQYQAAKMKAQGIFVSVSSDIGQIIVADVDADCVAELLKSDRESLKRLIRKEEEAAAHR